MGINRKQDADWKLVRAGVNPHTPGAALQKAARSRQVWSKSVRRQVLNGEWMQRYGTGTIPVSTPPRDWRMAPALSPAAR